MIAMSVMIATNIGIVGQSAIQQIIHSLIRIPRHTAIKLNPGRSQCSLCATADTTTDQRVHAERFEESCQCTVSAAVCIYNFTGKNLAAGNFIHLKLCRVAKMLENKSVFVSNCNTHKIYSFLFIAHSILLKKQPVNKTIDRCLGRAYT